LRWARAPQPPSRPAFASLLLVATQTELAARFLELHRPGQPLLMPNPWDVGTARILAALGFEALATTSAGHAVSEGGLDGTITREQAIAHGGALAAAVDVPVSADLENCFADSPEDVAQTVRMAIDAGDDADMREWAMHMTLVARAIERIGDNAVDIGEQTAFVVTGLFPEFTLPAHVPPS